MCLSSANAVAALAHGDDVPRRRRIFLELATEFRDVRVHRSGDDGCRVTPDFAQQAQPRDYGARALSSESSRSNSLGASSTAWLPRRTVCVPGRQRARHGPRCQQGRRQSQSRFPTHSRQESAELLGQKAARGTRAQVPVTFPGAVDPNGKARAWQRPHPSPCQATRNPVQMQWGHYVA